ncbi:MAG: DUF1295 domain-containing protein [Candidatus Bathyarchaeia archaeon]
MMYEVQNAVDELLGIVSPPYFGKTIDKNILRPIGYVAFVVTLFLIVLGLLIKRRWLAITGSVALYLPTFGYFAFTMWTLFGGIGVLRILWFPLLDLSPNTLELGNIVYWPFLIVSFLLLPLLFVTTGRNSLYLYELLPLSDVIMAFGLAILFLGVFTWLYGKFKGYQIIDFWIYRYSRHPQYLGYIMWSYGFLINTLLGPHPFSDRCLPPPSLPWLISTLIIIGVALHEENIMASVYGEKYIKYREKTPFIIPFPRKLAALVNVPTRILFKKKRPENGKEIIVTLLFYAIILILLSICFPTIFST